MWRLQLQRTDCTVEDCSAFLKHYDDARPDWHHMPAIEPPHPVAAELPIVLETFALATVPAPLVPHLAGLRTGGCG